MPKLAQVKSRDLVKIVTMLGFKFRAQSGSHAVYTHPDGRKTTIPIHPSQTIGIGLLTKIIKKDLKITRQNFIGLLS
ncbi:MAG: type II toxin-antitoxin system HicA family toxin [Patescibacteria group bacterium]